MNKEVKKYIAYPVRYESNCECIIDANDFLILDINGWARFGDKNNLEIIVDSVGEFVAQAINEKLKRNP